MIRWQLRAGTENRKLGPGTYVVTFSRDSCPPTCPLKGAGCYAEGGRLAIAWNRVTRGEAKHDGITRWAGSGFSDLASTMRRVVPSGTMLRLGDAGDPSWNGRLSRTLIRALGSLKRRGVSPVVYTHVDPTTPWNRAALQLASDLKVIVNVSHQGDLGLPHVGDPERVTVVPEGYPWQRQGKREGNEAGTIVRCPAETDPLMTCDRCRLCSRSRGFAVGFTAHGSRRKSLSRALESAVAR